MNRDLLLWKILELANKVIALFAQFPSEVLYRTARAQIGKDVAPTQNEYGCAEAVNFVCKEAFGEEIGGGLSTAKMYACLLASPKFRQVQVPVRGDVIISPTGFGGGAIPNGHVGIVSDGGRIMSNDSASGLFLENYTLARWEARYRARGGYPVLFFRRIAD